MKDIRRWVFGPGLILVTIMVSTSAQSVGSGQVGDGSALPDTHVAEARASQKSTNVSPHLLALRREVGRALTIEDGRRRGIQLRQIVERVDHEVRTNEEDNALCADLLGMKARIMGELGDALGAREAVVRQHAMVQRRATAQGFDEWLSAEANRCRDAGRLELAILHLQQSAGINPSSRASSERALLLGDILAQRAFLGGSSDEAIAQYMKVATEFRHSFSDLADDANLRRARMLMRLGRRDEAASLFCEVATRANPIVAEHGRHFLQILNAECPGVVLEGSER